MDPLKEAAIHSPNALALLGAFGPMTYQELDIAVDQVEEIPLLFPAADSFQTLLFLFAAWRRKLPFCPINPRLPSPPTLLSPPPHLLLLTSGSTALPKIAILPLASLLANAESAIGPLDFKANDLWRLNLPLYHVGGIAILLRACLARAAVSLIDSPDITHLSCVPTHLYRATPSYKKLRCLLVGGAPIPSYPFPIQTTYGLTEMSSMVTLNGKLLPNRKLCIQNHEICVAGPMLFSGYLHHPPHQGWFATGDLGHFDESGNLIIDGRKDWMFISGGENIQPEEIERALLLLPEIQEAIVVAKEDPEFGRRPAAIVRTNSAISLSDVQAKLAHILPKYKIPISLHFMEKIPQINDLKPDRFILSQIINNKQLSNTAGQKNAP